jgi:hypothetical protein
MKGKHLVCFEATDAGPAEWYTGKATGISNACNGLHRGPKSEATWLTKDQAKRLIDKCRRAKMDCHAIPTFNVTY